MGPSQQVSPVWQTLRRPRNFVAEPDFRTRPMPPSVLVSSARVVQLLCLQEACGGRRASRFACSTEGDRA